MLTKQRDRIAEKHASRDKEFEEERLLLKEDKLKLERSLSHLALDKEHIDKSKSILDEEVEKKTKDLTQEKESLMESRSNVQVGMILNVLSSFLLAYICFFFMRIFCNVGYPDFPIKLRLYNVVNIMHSTHL